MALRKLLKLSAIASALILAGCGGDLVVNAGGDNNGGGGGTPPPVASDCPAFATEGDSLAGVDLPVCEISGRQLMTCWACPTMNRLQNGAD